MAKVQGANFFKRHKKLMIFLIIVAILAVVFIYIADAVNKAKVLLTPQPETTSLVRQDLQQLVTTTGVARSTSIRQVNTTLTSEVVEVLVKVGDKVTAGDLICRLDTADVDRNIADLRSNIKTANDQDALQLAQAERRLQDASNQKTLDETRLNADVAAAEALEANAVNDFSVLTAKAEMEAAKFALDNANAALGLAVDPIDIENAQKDVGAAQMDFNVKEATYNMTYSSVVTGASTAAEKARQIRDTTLRANSITVETARDSVTTLKKTSSAKTFQTQLATYLSQKEKAEITAPISGTVTAVNAKVGAMAGVSASSSGLFTIDDLTSLEIPAYVPEYDAVHLSSGLLVDISSDALNGAQWTGKVTSISPAAVDANGNFLVVVKVTSPTGQLTGGMSAKMNIIVNEKNNVFAVPYDAVITNEQGQQVVYVYLAAQAEGASASGAEVATRSEIMVTTGIETDYYIEIVSDELKDGMLIMNDPLELNTSAGLVFNFGGGGA